MQHVSLPHHRLHFSAKPDHGSVRVVAYSETIPAPCGSSSGVGGLLAVKCGFPDAARLSHPSRICRCASA